MLSVYGLAPTLARRANPGGEVDLIASAVLVTTRDGVTDLRVWEESLGPEEAACAVTTPAPPEAFTCYQAAVVHVLERNEADLPLLMRVEKHLPLTTLLRRWAEDGPPPPREAPTIAPPRPPRLLAADELAEQGDRFTVGLDFGSHEILLDTRHAADAVYIREGGQEPELIMNLDAHAVRYWVIDGDVRAFAAAVAWITASLRAGEIDPMIEIYGEDVEEEEEPLDVLPLTGWLRFSHRNIPLVDERVQGAFADAWPTPRPRGPAYASFLATCVGHR